MIFLDGSRSRDVPRAKKTKPRPKESASRFGSTEPSIPPTTRRPAAVPVPVPVPPSSSSSSPSSSSSAIVVPPKPLRPLTAYHIFFQIEREYVIQTASGPDDDGSIHENKRHVSDVPRRYRRIKLLPDWYAGPGKRRKRKHRKSHGKIGFLELSRVISERWSTLESTDPETKVYVSTIAARELAEYRIEMKEYERRKMKEYERRTKVGITDRVEDEKIPASGPAADSGLAISPGASTSRGIRRDPEAVSPAIDEGETSRRRRSIRGRRSPKVSFDDDDLDYSICEVSDDGNYVPLTGPALGVDAVSANVSICDPLFELQNERDDDDATAGGRCISPLSDGDANEDIVENDFLRQLSPPGTYAM